MTVRVPRHAIRLMANTAIYSARHGFRQGAAKAVAKANPALLVIEAAVSVFEAINSYVSLKRAEKVRDSLAALLPKEEERLATQRMILQKQIDVAREELAREHLVREVVNKLALACAEYYGIAWKELEAIRLADLPDMAAFDTQLNQLNMAFDKFQNALALYAENEEQ